MLITGINNSFGSKNSPYVKRDNYTNGNDNIQRTRYFSKDGELVGFKLQHANGMVEYARETQTKNNPKIVLITKGYKNYNPVIAKVIIASDFYDDIALNRTKGHNPSIWNAIKTLEEKGLLKKIKKEQK